MYAEKNENSNPAGFNSPFSKI